MKQGWIHDWKEDARIYFTTLEASGAGAAAAAQRAFRKAFVTPLKSAPQASSTTLATLSWTVPCG